MDRGDQGSLRQYYLDGFAVRFAGPVRWNNEVAWGPAVIGMTDNFDPGYGEARQNFAFTHLDLEIPPIEKKEGWVEAVRLMRLDTSPRRRHRRQRAPRGPDRVFRRPVARGKQRLSGYDPWHVFPWGLHGARDVRPLGAR